jgi:DNA-directed RNA polymerase specialized sigma24 family protein
MDKALRKKINKYIYRLKKGDKEAEEILYTMYIGKIRLYVYRNVWIPEIKDPESLIEDIWVKLRVWFLGKSNYIKKNDKAVVYNIVRRECAAIAKKNIREPIYGTDPSKNDYSDNDDKIKPKFHKEILKSITSKSQENSANTELNINFKVSFYKILSNCLKELNERQKNVLDGYFGQFRTFEEIGKSISKTNVTAFNDCRKALESLRRCFNRYGIYSTGDLL